MRVLRNPLFCAIFLLIQQHAFSADIKGTVRDSITGDVMTGCVIFVKELKIGTVTGFDGTYILKNIPAGKHTLVCSYIGFNTIERIVKTDTLSEYSQVDFRMTQSDHFLGEVNIRAHVDPSTEISARKSERASPNLMNAVSAHTIEISPNLFVAGVLQRISGVSLENKANGSGQYAILRGMDKRYSYTLVNGIKIPSTNDKHRYVSLDLFPAALVDRVEVTKSLTPDMEGDAIAGVINLVMKNAPDKFLLQTNIAGGYGILWLSNSFQTFDKNSIKSKTPFESNGDKYMAVPSDFTKANLDLKKNARPLDINSGLTIGNRFFNKKLGWIAALSYNQSYTGNKSLIFGEDQSTDGKSLPVLTNMRQEIFYNQRTNYGMHNKFDFTISKNHEIDLYLAYINVQLLQVRDRETTEFQNNSYDPDHGSQNNSHSNRNWFNTQSLLNTTLQGKHNFGKHFYAKWSAVYSKAANQSPDMSTISYYRTFVNYELQPQYVDYDGSQRIWMHNSDEDKSLYIDLKYKIDAGAGDLEIAGGGLYRDKVRSSFVCSYTLDPLGPVDNHSAKGIDWDVYSEINWKVRNPLGAANVPGTYNAYENVRAQYGMITYKLRRFRIISGVRHEFTAQGYDEVFHNAFLDKFKPGNDQKRDHKYEFFLPSANVLYQANSKTNIKVAYYKAINKPGFYEIVPYYDNTGDYPVTGNPDLKVALADNLDLRYEYFPNSLDQFFAGLFYKKIENAIEQGFVVDTHGNYNLTYSNSNATNYGFEADFIKFFREYGIKANYTYTHSETSSYKRSQVNGMVNRDSTVSSLEYRPLYGQSKNVGNISLLYKSTDNGLNAQLAYSYIGKRIYQVSTDINGDYWQKGYWQLDASAEKKFGKGKSSIFFKTKNILNTHTIVYLVQANPNNGRFPKHSASDETTLLRNDCSGFSLLIGFRYKI